MVERTRVEFVEMNPLSAFISKIRNKKTKKTKLESMGPADPKDEKELSFFERHFEKLEQAWIISLIIIFISVVIGVCTLLPFYPFAPIALGIITISCIFIVHKVGH